MDVQLLISSVKQSLEITGADVDLTLQLQVPKLEIKSPGLQGANGVNGADADNIVIEAVAGTDLEAGFPVAINRANGKMLLADANYKPSAFVVGIITASVLSGFVGQASPARVTLNDWTAATGAPLLLQGQPYFLKPGGGLTTTPPGAGSCVVHVGIAVSVTTLQIDVRSPILM